MNQMCNKYGAGRIDIKDRDSWSLNSPGGLAMYSHVNQGPATLYSYIVKISSTSHFTFKD